MKKKNKVSTVGSSIQKFHVVTYDRLRQRILLKCVSHVQHDYFSPCNQPDHRFPALSLPLSLSMLNVLLVQQ